MKSDKLWYQFEEPENRKPLKALRYWLAQGMLYANNTERLYKVLFETVFLVLTTIILHLLFNLNLLMAVLLGAFISHNINFVVNCAVWETLICDLGFQGAGRKQLLSFVKDQRRRLSKQKSIACAFLYGSSARGELHDRSDLDVVFIRKPGLRNALIGLYIITKEKLFSLRERIPLELYLADSIAFLARPTPAEIPIIIDDKSGILTTSNRPVQTIENAEKTNMLSSE